VNAQNSEHMPSQVTDQIGLFDRFATWASTVVSRAVFFALCVLMVLVWAPSYFVIGNLDTYQLIINTATTIVTFLLVALIQNTHRRSNDAIQQKLNALADGIEDVMETLDVTAESRRELRQAVGLEDREGS
jgi:low affinity Fe/Cu permease